MLPVEQPFKTYTGLDGKPLDNGYVYFGQPNQNPITAPITVYWDAAGTQPAAQPLRTVNGYIVRAGTPANVFIGEAYSQLVQDKRGRQISYARTSNDFASATALLNYIASVASSIGSSLIGFIQAGIGAVARTVQDELRDVVKVSQFDTLQHAVDQAVATKKNLWLDTDVTLAALAMVDFSAASNMIVSGPGHIIGPSVAAQAQPTAYLKLWGTAGSPVSYGTTIAEGANSFTLAQSFAVDDLLLLSNFPADATDAYTEGAADFWGDKPRSYATVNTSNLRQTRRKELLVVSTASGSAFTTTTGAVQAYSSTTSLQFQKITPLRNLRFIGVTFENIHINMRYTRNVVFENCTALSCIVVGQSCYNTQLDFAEFDARGTDCRVDFYEKCRTIRANGVFKNINSPSDNAVLKFLGCDDISGVVTVEGCLNSNGFMVDTAFVENPTGYTDLPATNVNMTVTARSCDGQGVALTCDPYAAKVRYCTIRYSSDDTGVLLKGTEKIDLNANISSSDGSNNSIFLLGATDTTIYGEQRGGIFNDIVTNPRNGAQTQSTTGTSTIGSRITASSQPAFLAYQSTVTGTTGDGTEITIPFGPELFDKTNSHSVGTFTAPDEGQYDFDIVLKLNGVAAAHTSGWLSLVADGTDYLVQPCFAAIASATGDCAVSLSTKAYMRAGSIAQVKLKVSGGAQTVQVQGSSLLESYWSGALLN